MQSYIARAFGDRLDEVRAAMEALATSLVPEELNRVGFRLYERFRPDVPEGAHGGCQGVVVGGADCAGGGVRHQRPADATPRPAGSRGRR